MLGALYNTSKIQENGHAVYTLYRKLTDCSLFGNDKMIETSISFKCPL